MSTQPRNAPQKGLCMKNYLDQGRILKVTIKSGNIGCSDAQDACDQYGYLLLQKKGLNYFIDTPDDEDSENIVCVDSMDYIKLIVDSWGVLA